MLGSNARAFTMCGHAPAANGLPAIDNGLPSARRAKIDFDRAITENRRTRKHDFRCAPRRPEASKHCAGRHRRRCAQRLNRRLILRA
jgi:hypothetical protein